MLDAHRQYTQGFSLKVTSVIRLTDDEQKAALADILWLCSHSSLHKRYPLHIFHDRFLPSLKLQQYILSHDQDGRPVGFCNWIYLPQERLSKVAKAQCDIELKDWSASRKFEGLSGGNRQLFFPEFLAPFGHCRPMVRYLREQVFGPGTTGVSIRGVIGRQAEQANPEVKFFRA